MSAAEVELVVRFGMDIPSMGWHGARLVSERVRRC